MTPFLHERGASAQDIPSRIGVGVVPMITGDAFEDRLALAAPGVNDTTFGARLGRVGGGDVNQPPAGGFQFVFELAGENAPALRQDGFVQSSLLGHPLTWSRQRPRRRGGHPADIQSLQGNHAKTACNAMASRVKVVRTGAGDLRGSGHDAVALLCVALRPSLSASQDTLGPTLPALQIAKSWQTDHFACRERKGCCDASVYADSSCLPQGRGDDFCRERHLPAPTCARKRDIQYLAGDVSRSAIANPTYSRKAHFSPLRVQISPAQIFPSQPNAAANILASEAGEAGASVERHERPIEVAERVFETGSRNRSNEVKLATKSRHLQGLLAPRNAFACRSPILAPKITALFQGEVVDQPRRANPLTKNFGLVGGRSKRKGEGAMHAPSLAALPATPNEGEGAQ